MTLLHRLVFVCFGGLDSFSVDTTLLKEACRIVVVEKVPLRLEDEQLEYRVARCHQQTQQQVREYPLKPAVLDTQYPRETDQRKRYQQICTNQESALLNNRGIRVCGTYASQSQ